MKFCCEKFKKEAKKVQALAGGGYAYPEDMRPDAQIEWADGGWHVNGCCGGGCYVLTDIKYCPFCGTELPGEGSV